MSAARRNRSYTTAGMRLSQHDEAFGIRNNVYIENAQISAERREDVFCARDAVPVRKRGGYALSKKTSAFLLGMLALIFLIVIGGNGITKASLRGDIGKLYAEADELSDTLSGLRGELDEAYDTQTIRYRAVNELGMVNSLGSETVYITLNANGTFTSERNIGYMAYRTSSAH